MLLLIKFEFIDHVNSELVLNNITNNQNVSIWFFIWKHRIQTLLCEVFRFFILVIALRRNQKAICLRLSNFKYSEHFLNKTSPVKWVFNILKEWDFHCYKCQTFYTILLLSKAPLLERLFECTDSSSLILSFTFGCFCIVEKLYLT